MRCRWLIGIDEVGRGALAGPLVLAAVAAPVARCKPHAVGSLTVDRDSKRLLRRKREFLAQQLFESNGVHVMIVSVSHSTIDRMGMNEAGALGVQRLIKKIFPQHTAVPAERYSRSSRVLPPLILLDGGLFAPPHCRQLTVLRGDAQLPIIAAASIVAKVYRDRYMRRMHTRYPQYGFNVHYGYGTKAHYESLRRHGPSPIHRRTFRLR